MSCEQALNHNFIKIQGSNLLFSQNYGLIYLVAILRELSMFDALTAWLIVTDIAFAIMDAIQLPRVW